MLSMVEKLDILDQVLHSLKSRDDISSSTESQHSTSKPWWKLLPEETRYKDTGCELFPSCLNCPLPHCVYDQPWGKQRFLQKEMVNNIMVLSKQKKMTYDQIAAIFNISTRTVRRYLSTYASRL